MAKKKAKVKNTARTIAVVSKKETIYVTLTLTLRTGFEAYEKKSTNSKVVKDIEKYTLHALRNELAFIPFYINNEEACTSECRISVDQVYTS